MVNSKRYTCDDRFRDVPRPPDGWMGLSLEDTDNGGDLTQPPEAEPPRRGLVSRVLSRVVG